MVNFGSFTKYMDALYRLIWKYRIQRTVKTTNIKCFYTCKTNGVFSDCIESCITGKHNHKGRMFCKIGELKHHNVHWLLFLLFIFWISYFTWVFIQMLLSVLLWSPGPEFTEQCDCRDGFSLPIYMFQRHISNVR